MILIISILAIIAIPSFISGVRKVTFKNRAYDVTAILEKARAQALASQINAAKKIAPGGYGVQLQLADPAADATTQKAILFIDDWNVTAAKAVSLSYADVTNRVLPDGVFTIPTLTTPGDTILKTIMIDTPSYIELQQLKGLDKVGSAWGSATNNTVTVIFTPPYADTTITAANGTTTTGLQELTAVFNLKTEGIIGTLTLNRVTTTPELIFTKP